MFTVRRSLVLLLLPVLALALLVASRSTSTATPPARTVALADAPGAGSLTLAGIQSTPASPDTTLSVLAWSWGLSNSGTTHIGGGAGAGKANLQDISMTLPQTNVSPLLVEAISTGEHLTQAKLVVFRPGTTTPAEEYVVSDVLLTAFSAGGSAGKGPATANLTVNFARIEYRSFAANGTTVVHETCFEVVENVGC